MIIHAFAVCLVLVFVALGWWQLHRAETGNTRSYAYALEWPSFALLVIGFWAKICRDEMRQTAGGTADEPAAGAPAATESARARADASEADELAAYNRYVAARAELRNRT